MSNCFFRTRERWISDSVFFILAQEQKHPVFKKADIFKNVGLTGRQRDVQENIWHSVTRNLKQIFGYQLKESEKTKGCYYLLNEIQDSNDTNMRHLKFTDKEKAHHGLLMVVLSTVYMNNVRTFFKETNLCFFIS